MEAHRRKIMTKKHFVIIALFLLVVLFIPFYLYMPIEVSGYRPGNIPMLVLYAGFLSFTTVALIIFILIFIFKKKYIKEQITTLKRYRHLLFLMVKRDFVQRYRRSVLGILWSVLNPLLTMMVLTMVFSQIFRFNIDNFPVYVLSGQLIFNFFNDAASQAMGSIVNNGALIKKIYVPKYIFPVTKITSSIVNMSFTFIAFLIVFITTGERFNPTMLLVILPMLYTFIFALGVGMLLSSIVVFFRDISYIYGVGITLLMFLTPIMYPVELLPPRIYHLIHFNPMFHYVSYFRDLSLYGTLPGLWANIICIGFALSALSVGFFAIMSQQDKYILYI